MVEWNTANEIFYLSLPKRSTESTGERMTTAIEGESEFEHFHRYCLARDLCSALDVLDVASGEGYGSSILANIARSVIGVDVDPVAIAHARTAYSEVNLRFAQGSALDLPLGDASVDIVVSFETLEYVREHAREQMARAKHGRRCVENEPLRLQTAVCCAQEEKLSSASWSSVSPAIGGISRQK